MSERFGAITPDEAQDKIIREGRSAKAKFRVPQTIDDVSLVDYGVTGGNAMLTFTTANVADTSAQTQYFSAASLVK